MKRFTFAVNEVATHDMRQVGNHTPTEDSITIEAVNEEVARSLARAELAKRTPGVQKFHPGVVLRSEEVKPKPQPAAKPAEPKTQAPPSDPKEKETPAAT